jgi:hypothetical protein
MTRKHFKQLADIIGQAYAQADTFDDTKHFEYFMRYFVYDPIVVMCKDENSDFDQHRFSYAVATARDEAEKVASGQ